MNLSNPISPAAIRHHDMLSPGLGLLDAMIPSSLTSRSSKQQHAQSQFGQVPVHAPRALPGCRDP
jgi:hypothetical protein